MGHIRNAIDYRVFARTVSGHKRFYIRFLYNGKIFLTRATDAPTSPKAGAIAARIMQEEDLESIAKAKESGKRGALDDIDRYAQMPVSKFLLFFWDPQQSPYLSDLAAAGRPLSGSYIHSMRRNAERFFVPIPLFSEMPMRDIKLKHIDSLFRELRKSGKSRTMLNSIRRTIQTPCNWLSVRNGMSKINFAALIMPKDGARDRGILTLEELEKILNLEAVSPWYDSNQRPHLEIRALQWKNVDLQNGLIQVSSNYTNFDGIKPPKARSKRDVPISTALEGALLEARKIAQLLGAAEPNNFVLLNAADFHKPISDTTIKRAWLRVLRAIGISKEEQKARNLVVHGLRHLYATRLIDAGLTPIEAAKLTGHKVLSTLGRYSDHTQQETLRKSKQILDNIKP
ncbi:MAG: site-specific tyrosine recombinase XerC [Spirochaetes bacterium ADurb.Bin110]|nr:MAG: site-specific tyrosine recombinase XerC [Spirochaetes bacterium ADurb.Bin110]